MKQNNAYPFLKSLNLESDVERRLTNHLNRIVEGNDSVYKTPFAEDGKAELVQAKLDKVFKAKSVLINSTLNDLELDNRSKFGARSIALPWSERKDKLLENFEDFKISGKLVKDIVPSRLGLRPLSLASALKLLKNDTNSGLPFYIRKGKIKERVLNNFDDYISRRDPCILFTRTQESKKTRDVWGFPIADTLNEMKYYSPLLQFQKNQDYRAALLGPEVVGRHVCELVIKCRKHGWILVSIDFASYDKTVKRLLQSLAFRYIKGLFQSQFHSEIDYIQERFSTIGIVTPDGVLNGPHGVPSGSTFTNEVDSLVQMILALQLPFVKIENCQIQGDDAVYLIPDGHDSELYNQFKSFGLSVNESKSYKSKDFAVFLQCLYHIDYIDKGIFGGIYPIYRALNRICFQERWSDFEDFDMSGRDYYSIRTLCILENCKYHPLFDDFVRLIATSDKYNLDFSSQGLSNYVRMLETAQGTGGVLNNQFGDDASGIRNFESYKIVKNMS